MTKSKPDSKSAAMVSDPESRTTATGARSCPSSSSSVLSYGLPAASTYATPSWSAKPVGEPAALVEQRVDEPRRRFDLLPQHGRLRARDQVLDHAVLQRLVAKARAQGPIDPIRDRPGLAPARVDGARVGVRALVRLDAAEHPLGAGIQPVQIQVHRDRVDRARRPHHVGRDQLGAGAVLGLRRQDEARIPDVVGVALVIVVIDPGGQPAAEPLDERQRRLVERRAAALARERDVEHRHAPLQLASRAAASAASGTRSAAGWRSVWTARPKEDSRLSAGRPRQGATETECAATNRDRRLPDGAVGPAERQVLKHVGAPSDR